MLSTVLSVRVVTTAHSPPKSTGGFSWGTPAKLPTSFLTLSPGISFPSVTEAASFFFFSWEHYSSSSGASIGARGRGLFLGAATLHSQALVWLKGEGLESDALLAAQAMAVAGAGGAGTYKGVG